MILKSEKLIYRIFDKTKFFFTKRDGEERSDVVGDSLPAEVLLKKAPAVPRTHHALQGALYILSHFEY